MHTAVWLLFLAVALNNVQNIFCRISWCYRALLWSQFFILFWKSVPFPHLSSSCVTPPVADVCISSLFSLMSSPMMAACVSSCISPVEMFLIFDPSVFIDFGLCFCCWVDSLLVCSGALGVCIFQLCLNKACLVLPYPASCVLPAFGSEPCLPIYYSNIISTILLEMLLFLLLIFVVWLLLTEQLKTWQETGWERGGVTRTRGGCSDDTASVH